MTDEPTTAEAPPAITFPPEFVTACERLNLRVTAEHYALWLDGMRRCGAYHMFAVEELAKIQRTA